MINGVDIIGASSSTRGVPDTILLFLLGDESMGCIYNSEMHWHKMQMSIPLIWHCHTTRPNPPPDDLLITLDFPVLITNE